MFYKFYIEDKHLVIEDSIVLKKVDVTSFDDIIISYNYPTRKYHVSMFFTKPVKYEPRQGFLKRMICAIFKHNNDLMEIKRVYYDSDTEKLLNIIKQILPSANIPNIKDSVFWKTDDEGMRFHRTKLVYSREGLGLKQVMLKHKILLKNDN